MVVKLNPRAGPWVVTPPLPKCGAAGRVDDRLLAAVPLTIKVSLAVGSPPLTLIAPVRPAGVLGLFRLIVSLRPGPLRLRFVLLRKLSCSKASTATRPRAPLGVAGAAGAEPTV